METSSALSLKSCPWIGFERIGKKSNGSMRFSTEERSLQKLNLRDLKTRSGVSIQSRPVASKISCSYEKAAGGETNLPVSDVSGCREYIGKSPVQFVGNPYDLQVVVRESLGTCLIFHLTAPAVESESSYTSVDEALILKKKAKDVLPYLNGRCIYLVGMMGSGKTTVGKILSEALGYSFFDSDKLVEQAVGGTTVSQIFKQYSEAFFRDNESEVLRDLSSMRRLVVATGGGAVIRPINWRYMKQGITVWLDVPLEALARRIAAVGTDSRPLLHQESGDAYTKAFARLTTLFGERGEAYANADSTVSLQYIATKQGHVDVGVITPTAIAIEALIQIENCLNAESNGMCL